MLERKTKRPKIFRIVIIFSLFFLICVELYIVLVALYTVNVSSFDVEVVGNSAIINESKKTYSIKDYNGDIIKESREYKEVLDINKSYAAVIDIDNQLKLIDLDDIEVAVFKDFTINTNNIYSTSIYEEQNIIKINLVEKIDEEEIITEYCYNKLTDKVYATRK